MKKLFIVVLLLIATAVFAGNTILTIRNGEITVGKTTTTQTYTYKGSQVLFYTLGTDKKINVYFITSGQPLTIDTTQLYSYNDTVGTISVDTVMAHLKTVSE